MKSSALISVLVLLLGSTGLADPLPTASATNSSTMCPSIIELASTNGSDYDYPTSAGLARRSGVSKILVSLDRDGNVTDTSVYQTSGSADLDKAAIQSARYTAYKPAMFACGGRSGHYIFTADFSLRDSIF